MTKIKTIIAQTPAEFDNIVNDALDQGWTLKRRDVLPPYEGDVKRFPRLYYAELALEPCCENCRHEDCDPDDPNTPCFHCDDDDRWEARRA